MKRCPNCGACKECGAHPYPRPAYPQPRPWPTYPRPWPGTYYPRLYDTNISSPQISGGTISNTTGGNYQ